MKAAVLTGKIQKDSLFAVEVRDSEGRTGTATCQVTIVPPLKVSLPARIQVTKGEKYTLRPQVAGGRPPYTYRWYRDGGLLKHSGSEGTGTAAQSLAIRVEVVDAAGQTQGITCQVEVKAAAATEAPPQAPPLAAEARYTLHLVYQVDPQEAYLSGEIGLGEKAESSSRVDVVVRGAGIFAGSGQIGSVQGGRVSFRVTVDGQTLECRGSLGPSGGTGTTQGRYGTGTWRLMPR
ncbi:MAG: hypothetical protein HY319_11225 [Armatimonadetes bacterium]|nr:hypothetical protein [Armatimonadota bacterium]